MKLRSTQFLPAIGWFIISLVGLTLPGTKFPKEPIFQIPQQDKILHFTIFFVLVYLFSRPFRHSLLSKKQRDAWFLKITLFNLFYGIVIEFVQKYFIENRSFEGWDIFADALGCVAAYLYSRRYFSNEKLL